MAKTKYTFEKRQRDLAKKKKKEEKLQRKLERKAEKPVELDENGNPIEATPTDPDAAEADSTEAEPAGPETGGEA